MPIDQLDTPDSDAWWLRRLAKQMHERPTRVPSKLCEDRRWDYTRNEWLDMLWARFTGNAPLLHIAEQYTDATREFMRLTRTNFAALVVEALQDRTEYQGAQSVGEEDADGDDTVRDFLTTNGAFMDDALTYCYSMGRGYVMVSPPQPGESVATGTAEDPRQISISVDPVRPNVIRAALKLYRDDDQGVDRAHLFRPADQNGPDRVRVAVRTSGVSWSGFRFSGRDWAWDDEASGPLDVQGLGVPIVPLINRRDMGEFEPHIDLLDRITNDIADRLWASKFQIFIQRAVKGDLPEYDEQGNKIDYNAIFSPDPGALWRLPNTAELWESRQLDINALLAPVRDDLKELSAVSGTPMHMFTPDAMTGSAAGASLATDTITLKARNRTRRLTPAGIRIARLGLAYSGKPWDRELVPMWGPVERFSLAERGAAAQQGQLSGVPWRSRMSTLWQFSPQEVARMERERRQDLLYAADTADVADQTQGSPATRPGAAGSPAPDDQQQPAQ